MIKKIIGGLFAVAVIAVIVFTAIGAGSYESMLPENLFKRSVEPVVEVVEPVAEESTEVVEMQDSVTMENAMEVADDAVDAAEAESAEQA